MASSLRSTVDSAMDEDDGFELDFSEARDALEPLAEVPVGEYHVTVTASKAARSKADNPMVSLKLAIDDEDKVEGSWPSLQRHCPSTGAGAGILAEAMTAFGIDVDAVKAGTLSFKPSDLIDRRAIAVVGVQKDDKTKTEVKNLKAIPGTTAKPAAKRTRKL